MIYARYALWAIAAGALIPVMAVLNARLGRVLGEPAHAGVVLLAVGLTCAVLACVMLTGGLPDVGRLASIAPIDLAGGAIVAFYVFSITILAPRFGLGNAILFVVAAQIVTAAAIDHFGLLGAAIRPVTPLRAVGLVILIAGLAVAQLAA